jgi:hypothetical protein
VVSQKISVEFNSASRALSSTSSAFFGLTDVGTRASKCSTLATNCQTKKDATSLHCRPGDEPPRQSACKTLEKGLDLLSAFIHVARGNA